MRRLYVPLAVLCTVMLFSAYVGVSAHDNNQPRRGDGWFKNRHMRESIAAVIAQHRGTASLKPTLNAAGPPASVTAMQEGRRLFEKETFAGNGRTCKTCHSSETGTVSPEDAQKRFKDNPHDPLFVHDGSDDDNGDGFGDGVHVTRMLDRATILMRIQLHHNVTLKNDPSARFVTVRRGIPTTTNTPFFDPVLMLDGRQPSLESQALGAITDHAQATRPVQGSELTLIRDFQQQTPRFFSSDALRTFANGGPPPALPLGRTASEKRGRKFFEDVPPDFSGPTPDFRPGFCSSCHSGPLMNQTNVFLPLPLPPGSRFQNVLVSDFNVMGNPVIDFVFHNQANDVFDGNPDGIIEVHSPDPGRALITGIAGDFVTATFDSENAFKISPLRGIRNTAPYFHDNSARTLEDVATHYANFFAAVLDPDGPGPAPSIQTLSEQDKKDIVAFLKLLD
jgi:cytochrome c peroxidase